ncbi:hypothetical protein ACFQUU_28030 [Herbaspirillum sp. GCM10030257]|uniref:hypothetical protein n=1 Tax=Herbaspirillum sp. GCM10030257 TaxID=3273393 RepID=UPI00360D14B2
MDKYLIYRRDDEEVIRRIPLHGSRGGNEMAPLQNPAIERLEKIFDVELVIFGTYTHCATKRIVKVLAQTSKGAKKICKWRYRRSEIKGTRAVSDPDMLIAPDLFPAYEI